MGCHQNTWFCSWKKSLVCYLCCTLRTKCFLSYTIVMTSNWGALQDTEEVLICVLKTDEKTRRILLLFDAGFLCQHCRISACCRSIKLHLRKEGCSFFLFLQPPFSAAFLLYSSSANAEKTCCRYWIELTCFVPYTIG